MARSPNPAVMSQSAQSLLPHDELFIVECVLNETDLSANQNAASDYFSALNDKQKCNTVDLFCAQVLPVLPLWF
jgi:hypothetical protein